MENKTTDELLETLEGYRELSTTNIPHELGKELLKRAYSDYSFEYILDIGGESSIFLAKDFSSKYVIIKVPHYRLTHIKEYKRDIYKDLVAGFRKLIQTFEPNKYVERFIEGIKIQNKLSNDNTDPNFVIPKVYTVKQTPFLSYSMEYIEGIKIIRWISEQHNLKTSLTLFLKILQCIKYIHDYGVIHRDIKSDNILYTTKNRIAMLDWTLSKTIGRSLTVVGSDLPLGSMPYASPKQLMLRNAGEATYLDDIFSLGITFYEFITFKKLVVDRNYNNSLTNFRNYINTLAQNVPKFLRSIFEKATAIDEDLRYCLITDFYNDVKEALLMVEASTVERTEILKQPTNFDCLTCQYDCKYDICNKLYRLYKCLGDLYET